MNNFLLMSSCKNVIASVAKLLFHPPYVPQGRKWLAQLNKCSVFEKDINTIDDNHVLFQPE